MVPESISIPVPIFVENYCIMHCNPYCENMFNLYVTLRIFDIRHITIQLFTCVLSNKSKKILCMKCKVTNTTTCCRLMLQHYMSKINMPKNVEQ